MVVTEPGHFFFKILDLTLIQRPLLHILVFDVPDIEIFLFDEILRLIELFLNCGLLCSHLVVQGCESGLFGQLIAHQVILLIDEYFDPLLELLKLFLGDGGLRSHQVGSRDADLISALTFHEDFILVKVLLELQVLCQLLLRLELFITVLKLEGKISNFGFCALILLVESLYNA